MESKISVDSKGRKSVTNVCAEPCAIEKGMRLIGGKWKGSLIFHLKDGPVRFNDLARMLGGASKDDRPTPERARSGRYGGAQSD